MNKINFETVTQGELAKILREKVKSLYEFLEEVEAKTDFQVTALSQMSILDKSDIADVKMQSVFRMLGRNTDIAITLSEIDYKNLDDVLSMYSILKKDWVYENE